MRRWVARLASSLRAEWREVGILGRVALVGVAVSLGVAVWLGLWIPEMATGHLLEARAELMEGIGSDIVSEGMLPVGPAGSSSFRRLDEQVDLRLVGGETVRVKLWSLEGTILYSDDVDLVGRRFGLSESARAALEGDTSFNISDLEDPAHAGERELGRLIEFYVPVRGDGGEPVALFEIEQRVDDLENTRRHVQQGVWLAIGSGIGVLSVFMGSLTVATARVMNRRRREAEQLLRALFRAQEEERSRTVGALHDDVGQPLYRLLYGLEATAAKLAPDSDARAELQRLEELVREVDRRLRAELRQLHRGVQEGLDLASAIDDLVAMTERETGLDVEVEAPEGCDEGLSVVGRVALVHAAREALINVRRHAAARRVEVRVERRRDRVTLVVVDDGRGMRGEEGLGLTTLRERLEAIGGGLRVSGRRGSGTRMRAWVPITEELEAAER